MPRPDLSNVVLVGGWADGRRVKWRGTHYRVAKPVPERNEFELVGYKLERFRADDEDFYYGLHVSLRSADAVAALLSRYPKEQHG